MKNLFFFIQLIIAVMMYSSMSYADEHGWEGHGHHGGRHHGHHGYDQDYYPQPQINYYPPPQVIYYPQPQAYYYPPQPRYNGYDQRSHQGLAGGVIGGVIGYEMGNGNPVAAGLGAAAGSYLGNGRW